jgi:hypothetical protein
VTTRQQLLLEIETAKMRLAWAKAEMKRGEPSPALAKYLAGCLQELRALKSLITSSRAAKRLQPSPPAHARRRGLGRTNATPTPRTGISDYLHPPRLNSSYSGSCEKREQLAKVFLHTAIEVEKVSKETEDTPSGALPQVLFEAYAVCKKARMDLYRHKTVHGC